MLHRLAAQGGSNVAAAVAVAGVPIAAAACLAHSPIAAACFAAACLAAACFAADCLPHSMTDLLGALSANNSDSAVGLSRARTCAYCDGGGGRVQLGIGDWGRGGGGGGGSGGGGAGFVACGRVFGCGGDALRPKVRTASGCCRGGQAQCVGFDGRSVVAGPGIAHAMGD